MDRVYISLPSRVLVNRAEISPNHQIARRRSEEHTSELQSQSNLVCRLLLEKKNNTHHPALAAPPGASESDDCELLAVNGSASPSCLAAILLFYVLHGSTRHTV